MGDRASVIDAIRAKIETIGSNEWRVWSSALDHSKDYMNVAGLSHTQIELIERNQRNPMYITKDNMADCGFFSFNADGEVFNIMVRDVCAHPYGLKKWVHLMMVVCVSRPELNETVGRGTAFVTTLNWSWHHKVLEALKENK